jgi:hypothetical protein
MKKNLHSTIIAAFFSLFPILTFGQTGHSLRTIMTTDPLLNGDSLSIYFHVPESYDSNIPSKLIIGFHGLGNPENSVQIRQYMTQLGDSINAVVMCPNPYLQDQPRSEAVLYEAYDSVMTWFNIDTNQVYIVGYSAGSDVAAQYVFNEPAHIMKGLIWHSPGFFFNPDLSSPEEIPPVCLCIGTQDFTSIIQTNLLNNNLGNSSIPYLYNVIPGVDHTMEYPTFTEEMMECIAFIDAQYNLGLNEMNTQFIRISPNPIRQGDALQFQAENGSYKLTIVDMLGKQRYSKTHTITNGKAEIQGLSSQLTSGVYFLKIATEKGAIAQRFVIE